MENIYDEIFEFLFEKYLEARAKGEEFYFRIWQSSNTEYKNYLIVSFWDTKDTSINIDLWVNIKNSECYLYISNNWHPIRFSDYKDFDQKEEKIEREIYESIAKRVKKQPKETLGYSQESFVKKNSLKSYKKDTIFQSIQAFLEQDKIEIDNYLKENNRNYFWQESKFVIHVSKVRQLQADRNKKLFVAGLPFCLRSISIKNYKAIQQLEIEDIPSTTRWIFLTGENGIGKTLVLEAIALGLQEAYWLESNAERDKCVIETQYQTNLSEVNCSLNQQSIPNNYIMPHNNIPVVAYNCNRLSEIENKLSIGIAHLFEKASLIEIDKWLTMLLKKIDSAESDKLQGLIIDEVQLIKDKNIFQTLLTTFQKILPIYDIVLHPEKESVLYNEQNENGEVISSVPFSQLSAGYKTLLCIISDMIVRLSSQKIPENITSYSVNQWLHGFASDAEYNNENTIKSPEELMGIVIIDEFENHLHAKFQRKSVEVLTTLFPKVQFIVSTHSPIPLLGAPKDKMLVFEVERTLEDGISLRKINEDISKMLPNELFEDFFGFQDIFPQGYDIRKMITKGDYENEILFNQKVQQRVNDFLGTEEMERLMNLLNTKNKK